MLRPNPMRAPLRVSAPKLAQQRDAGTKSSTRGPNHVLAITFGWGYASGMGHRNRVNSAATVTHTKVIARFFMLSMLAVVAS